MVVGRAPPPPPASGRRPGPGTPTLIAPAGTPSAGIVTPPSPPEPPAPTARRLTVMEEGGRAAEGPRLRLVGGKVVPGTRYRIVRWLGEGGMGVVYEAEHVDIERRVALKILRSDLSQQPKMVQVFRDEARASSRIGSAHIVEIYDFGELPDGRVFFCMELLEGRDLVLASTDDWIRPAELIAILRQVCKGLQAAHGAGIVHRDIKPENLISVARGGRSGHIKIVDFGISGMLAAGSAGGDRIAGTPHYMAPEQVTGGAFDGRLDLYALGCTAYELLMGQPPFDADDVPDLLDKQMYETPRPFRDVRPDRDVPPALERVILRCLAKNPAERPASAAELEAELCEAQIAAGLHTPWDDLAIPDIGDGERRERLLHDMPSPLAEAAVRPRRRWVVPVLLGVLVLGGAGAGAWVTIERNKPTGADLEAVERLVARAHEAAAKARYVVPPPDQPDVDTALKGVVELEATSGRAAKVADARAFELRGEFAHTLVELGDQLWDVPGARPLAIDRYRQALAFDDTYTRALDRAKMTPGQLADFYERAQRGEFTESELALTRLEQAVEPDGTVNVETLDDIDLEIHGLRRRPAAKEPEPVPVPPPAPPPVEPAPEPMVEIEAVEEPKKKANLGLDRHRAMFGEAKRDPARAAELAEQGAAALRAGRRSEAEGLFNQAISYDRTNAQALMGLSDVYFDTGKSTTAVMYAERAVQASSGNRTFRLKLGDAYFRVLRYRDALSQYEEAKRLGEPRADDRITRVRAKLGDG